MTPHYKMIEVGGKELVVFYPQFKDDDGYKIIDKDNRFPIELKNHDEYMSFLETLVEREQELKDGLTTLADLIEEMDMLARGPKGDTRYMWVKYADDEQGNGMSDDPTGKKYIGFAFNKDEETPSDEPSDYTWARYYPDLTDVRDELQTVKESINSHVNNKNNPHEVTKSQIGLGNVQNYGIASQSQAENGTSNNAYMTPLRTKQAIEKLSPSYVIDTEIGDDYILKKYSDGTFELKGHHKRTESLTSMTNDLYRTGNLFTELTPIMDDSFKLVYSNAWIMDGHVNTFLVMSSFSNPLSDKRIRYRITGNNTSPNEDVEFIIGYEAYGTWS